MHHKVPSFKQAYNTSRSLLEAEPIDQRVPIIAAKRLALAALACDGAHRHSGDVLTTARQSALGEGTLWTRRYNVARETCTGNDSLDTLFGGAGLSFELVETPAAGL